jgi:hypothetical protein
VFCNTLVTLWSLVALLSCSGNQFLADRLQAFSASSVNLCSSASLTAFWFQRLCMSSPVTRKKNVNLLIPFHSTKFECYS